MTRATLRSTGLFLLLLLALGASQAAVRATVGNTSVPADSAIELTLEHDGQTSDEPDLAPLKQDFDILVTSRGTSMQIVNGSMSSHVRLRLSLSPKHGGQLRIPAIAWGSEHTEPITVTVGGGAPNGMSSSANGANSRPVFLETSIDTPQPYVQAGVKLTVRLYAATPLYHANLEVPASNDVLVQQLGADRNETRVVGGQRYQMFERHYEVFPQRSGQLTLPEPVLNAQIAVQDRTNPFGDAFQDFFGNSPFGGMVTSTKPIRVHGDALLLNVLPRPDSATSDYWLPGHDLTLGGEWHPDQSQAKAGDPVTLDLHLRVQGLTAAQLPDLSQYLKLPLGLKAYPDQAKLTNDVQGEGVAGTREQSIAIIADKPGNFTVPALTVHWWDTQSNQAREATLPEHTLSIMPGGTTAQDSVTQIPAPAAATPPPISSDSDQARIQPSVGNIWRWVSLGAVALWIITLVAWYLTRRRKEPAAREPKAATAQNPSTSEARARADFQSACRRNDARPARANLLAWINAAQPQPRVTGLGAFAKRVQNESLAALLLDLDRACYGGGDWQGAGLLEALRELPKQPQSPRSDNDLATLYP